MLQQSERAAESGEIGTALVYTERAVRLDPRRADLWTRMAELTLADGDPDTAIRYANKALSLARDRVDWQREAWLVIADARESLGDADGCARDPRAMANLPGLRLSRACQIIQTGRSVDDACHAESRPGLSESLTQRAFEAEPQPLCHPPASDVVIIHSELDPMCAEPTKRRVRRAPGWLH